MPSRDNDPVFPEIFAVGGGTNDVLPLLGVPELPPLGDDFPSSAPTGLFFGVSEPPYFFSSSCVVSYLVADLSFSIVISRCFCSSSRFD